MFPHSQVLAQASHALKRSSHLALRGLNVEGSDDSLIISGTVATWYLKQLAQETLKPVRGECQLLNLVRVNTN
jgi:hypothetical protein